MRTKEDAERIMETFDAFPPPIRELLTNCPDPRVMLKCRQMLDQGMPEAWVISWLKPTLKRFTIERKAK